MQTPRDLNKVINILSTRSELNRSETLVEVGKELGLPFIKDDDEVWINTLNLAARMLIPRHARLRAVLLPTSAAGDVGVAVEVALDVLGVREGGTAEGADVGLVAAE